MIGEERIKRISEHFEEPEWLLELRLRNMEKYYELKKLRIADSPIEKSYSNFSIDRFFSGINCDRGLGGQIYPEENYFVLDYRDVGNLNFYIKTEFFEMMDMRSAIKSYPETVKESMNFVKDQHTAISNATFLGGLFIKFNENKDLAHPLKIKVKYTGGFYSIKNIIVIGKNVKSEFIEHLQMDPAFMGISNTYMRQENESKVKHITMLDGNGCENLNVKNSYQGENSIDEWYVAIKNSSNSSINSNIILNEGSRFKNYTGVISGGQEIYDISSNVYHQGKNSNSESIIRTVTAGESRIVSRGIIEMDINAKNSYGYYAAHSILLGERSRAYSLPFLKIYGDGSSAKHESSISNIDDEMLFYLKSHGLDEMKSKDLIIQGFIDPVVRELLIYEGKRFLVYGEESSTPR